MALYTIKDLRKERKGAQQYTLIIRHLTIEKGERLAITGPSGCGKSTTLDLLGLALCADRATTFTFAPEKEVFDIQALFFAQKRSFVSRLRRTYLGYVLQTGELLPFLNVENNLTLTAELAGIEPKEARKRVQALAEELDISHLLSAKPLNLSVGERQRAAIVRALVPNPLILLCDEPTASLDPLHAEGVLKALLDAVADLHTTLILVSHDHAFVQKAKLREISFTLTREEEHVYAILDDGKEG